MSSVAVVLHTLTFAVSMKSRFRDNDSEHGLCVCVSEWEKKRTKKKIVTSVALANFWIDVLNAFYSLSRAETHTHTLSLSITSCCVDSIQLQHMKCNFSCKFNETNYFQINWNSLAWIQWAYCELWFVPRVVNDSNWARISNILHYSKFNKLDFPFCTCILSFARTSLVVPIKDLQTVINAKRFFGICQKFYLVDDRV